MIKELQHIFIIKNKNMPNKLKYIQIIKYKKTLVQNL